MEKLFSLSLILNALDLKSTSPGPKGFDALSTDSRKVTHGTLFVAVPGDKFDGHAFIEKAIQAGATGILCKKGTVPPPCPHPIHFFEVEDTVLAYRSIAHAWRAQFSIPIIAVAGSNGKTTTKELLASILAGKFKHVLKTTGSQNGFLGIPMTLLELRQEHEIAVIEVGIDDKDTMDSHMELVRPTAAVLTSIGPEHLEKLIDVDTVAKEEAKALHFIAKNAGSIAFNEDDPRIKSLKPSLAGAKLFPFSLHTSPSDGKSLHWNGQTFDLPLLGKHNASNLLAALTLASLHGLSPKEIKEGLSRFTPATGRSEIRKLAQEITVLCDYYNANPASMIAGIALLREISPTAPTCHACLGDMLEQGIQEEALHRSLADQLMNSHIENVFLYGPRMKWLEAELKNRHFKGAVEHFETHAALSQKLKGSLKPHDSVLIKGSRGMKMEEVWRELESHRS